MDEVWKSIPGYEGLYEVSDAGNVRCIRRPRQLSARDVKAITRAQQRGVPVRALAQAFGFSRGGIKHLKDTYSFTRRTPFLLNPSLTRHGYPRVALYKDGARTTHKVHHLVTKAFLGPMPEGLVCNHMNGIRTDNRLVNLEYVTRSANILHAYRVLHKKPYPSGPGSAHHQAKLHESNFPLMREMYAQGMSQTAIAKHFGVSRRTIHNAYTGVTWKHMHKH